MTNLNEEVVLDKPMKGSKLKTRTLAFIAVASVLGILGITGYVQWSEMSPDHISPVIGQTLNFLQDLVILVLGYLTGSLRPDTKSES